jgi:predicted phosphodiesterase
MRIAAVSDIHGNLEALEAVLADIDTVDVDHLIFCGDTVLGAPDDKACWQRILTTGAPVIRGNTDRYVAQFGTDEAEPRWKTQQFGPLQYAVSQFTDDEREELGRLPTRHKFSDVPDVLFYHATPHNDMDIWRSYTSDEEMEELFFPVEEAVLVGGHNHTQQVRAWDGHTIVLCGSVGATNDYSAGAQYI